MKSCWAEERISFFPGQVTRGLFLSTDWDGSGTLSHPDIQCIVKAPQMHRATGEFEVRLEKQSFSW
jgi:hypothetical protein